MKLVVGFPAECEVRLDRDCMASIGHYQLGDVLGVGTVGTVYRGKDLENDQDIAIKILLPQISVHSNIARRFQREMSILEKLEHPHIVRYLSGDEESGRLYYAMELVDSGSLKDELTIHGRLSWQQVCSYGIQICSALQYAHNHGIVHRDLKPSNLFMDESGNLKLGDFGVARDTYQADLTDAGLTVGTYAYMSPEQICAESAITDKADLYSLGCLLYEMLSGHQPFEGANFAQIFEQHLHHEPPPVRKTVPDCPEQLEEMIVSLMAKKPDERPFNARYVQGFLSELLEEQGDRTSPQPATSKKDHSGLSQYANVSWAMVVALLLLIVVAIFVVLWLQYLVA